MGEEREREEGMVKGDMLVLVGVCCGRKVPGNHHTLYPTVFIVLLGVVVHAIIIFSF